MSSQTAHPPQHKAAVRLNNNHCNGAFMHKGIILCKQTLVVIPLRIQYIVTTSHKLGAANFTPIKQCATQNWNMRDPAYLTALLHTHAFTPSWHHTTSALILRIPDRFIERPNKSPRSETNQRWLKSVLEWYVETVQRGEARCVPDASPLSSMRNNWNDSATSEEQDTQWGETWGRGRPCRSS